MVKPWLDAGDECWIVDVRHPPGACRDGKLVRVGADVTDWRPHKPYDIVFAFPPCTNLASSGARWFKDKGLAGLIEGLRSVEACRAICEGSGAPWMLENPIGTLATYWRQPDFRFDPSDYAGMLDDPESEAYTKKTCLWVGNGFRMPEKAPVEPTKGSAMHVLPASSRRADLRSVTPLGFAKAVFEANR